LRGTYSIIDKTDLAISVLGKTLNKLKIANAVIYLDAPISNSGRLKTKIFEYSKEFTFNIDVMIVQNPDVILQDMADIVTSDSVILDNCKSWFNLSKTILDDYIKDAKVIFI
jgi:hypothetical protein